MSANLIYVVLDSCRYDSLLAARTPNIDSIGPTQRRYSYASWTSPSHFTFLMGMIPHGSPVGVFASEVYKGEFSNWVDRLHIKELSFKTFLPQLSLPKVLQDQGYRTFARVSLPVLNKAAGINRYFDDYRLMKSHDDFAGMLDEIEFHEDENQFVFLNIGETHYPYMSKPDQLPYISGLHGVLQRLDDNVGQEANTDDRFFDAKQMESLHKKQQHCVEYVDELLGALIESAPVGSHFIITSDHGECFGEAGYFGHGPIFHEKVFEIPFIEGKKR